MSYQQPASPPPPTAPTYELSGWWRRVGATAIDGILIGVFAGPIGLATGSLDFSSGAEFDEMDLFVWTVINAAVMLPLIVGVMGYTGGQTIGKKAAGIRVVREDGKPVTYGFAAIRELLVKQLLFGTLLGAITIYIGVLVNYLWPLWDSGNRALHDMMVKTRVVRDGVALQAPVPPVRDAPAWPSPQQPEQPPFPVAPPAPPDASAQPTPPAGQPYEPPPEFENPVPDK